MNKVAVFYLMISCVLFNLMTLGAQEVKVLGNKPVIQVDNATKSGSCIVSLKNITDQEIDLLLTTENLIHKGSEKTIPAQILFNTKGSNDETSVFIAKLAGTSSINLTVKVNTFNVFGEFTTKLLNNNEEIGELTIIAADFQLNLSVAVPNPNSPEITFRRNKSDMIVIQNKGEDDYYIDLSIYIKESDIFIRDSGILCKAGTDTEVRIMIPDSCFSHWFSGLFKDEIKDAVLNFKHISNGKYKVKSPSKEIALKVIFQYYSESTKIWGSVIIFFVLLLGGGVSLFLNLWIPNRLMRIGLVTELNKIYVKNRSISNLVDSYLRVNMMVERMRLYELVTNTKSLNPNSASIFKEYKSEIKLLEKRVIIVEKLDVVCHFFEDLKGKAYGAPAKIMDNVDKLLSESSNILQLSVPDSAKLQKAEDNINTAEGSLRKMTEKDPELAKFLAGSVNNLIEIYKKLEETEKCKELKTKLKDLFSMVNPTNNQYIKEENIEPKHYHWLSSSVERLYVLRHYIGIWENYESRREVMESRENEFIANLNSRTWIALNLARQFRAQFEENIYARQITESLKKEAFNIEISPSIQPRKNQPVNLEVSFEHGVLNTSSARKEITCVWDFGLIGKEKGWRISHYFRNQTEANFSLYFNDREGKRIKLLDEKEHFSVDNVIIQSDSKRISNERYTIELVKFMVAFIVALVALYSGAKVELMKMEVIAGLIAVFGMGFTADTIKNLITRQVSED